MINKRIKAGLRRLHKDNDRIGFSLGTMALIAACIFLLITATFTLIKINFNMPEDTMNSNLTFEYIPQIPVVLFIGALLGECWGLVSILLYIILGLTPMFPIFALGGGLSYIFQYNFGYIFSYLFAVVVCAKEIRSKNSFLTKFLAVVYSIILIHIIGGVYMIIIALLRHESFDFIINWLYYQSISKILYDLVFGFIAVLLATGIRKAFWMLIN